MIKLKKGLYIHFSVGIVFLIAYFTGTFSVTVMAFSISVCHELCHLLSALILKEKCHAVAIMPYGCRLYMTGTASGKNEIVIASAGPLFNVLMAFLIKNGPLYDVNAAMAIINLFPVMPLDGGRIMYALLSLAKGPFFAQSFMKRVSFLGGALLTALGVYQAIATGFNLSVFTSGTFLLFASICENGRERLYMGLFTEKSKLSSGAKKGMVIAADESLPLRKVLPLISPGDYAVVKVIGRDGKIEKEMSEDEIKGEIISKGAGVRFREIT